MPPLRADSPLQYIRGVGPRIAQSFASLGLHTVSDLLDYLPFRYDVEHGEAEIADLQLGAVATIRGEIVDARRDHVNFRCTISDGTGECTLRWFNQPYAGRSMARGATVVATGTVREWNGEPEMVQPQVQVFGGDTPLLARRDGGGRIGVYRGNAQIKSPTIRRAVRSVLTFGSLPIEDDIPPALLRKHAFPGREEAIRSMHAPPSDAALESARRRLAYEEFLAMELVMALRRRKLLSLQSGRKLRITPEIDQRIRARFPFALTAAQDAVVKEIAADLASGRPMTRLLQGDVGSGKTVVALYACLAAIANGRQAAIMAPTEILAQQHFQNIEKYLADSRVRRVLMRGGMARTARSTHRAAIERGELDLIVGTQALLERDVGFKDLALVVVDEQHKFGVAQRADFRTKGPMPHCLVMTATPIPRSLAMTVFGDLDVSVIRASPPGRGRILTRIVTRREWDVVMGYVRGRLEAGEQAYVVCPQIGENAEQSAAAPHSEPPRSDHEVVSVQSTYRRLIDGPWRGLRVSLLHGGLKSAEKDEAIRAFAAGRVQALVSTTVVEVGVDVANATIMIVENADRFGLSQLHQLRGRIGRGAKDSLCVLIAYEGGMQAAKKTADGTRLAGSARAKPEADFGKPRGKAAERLAVLAETSDGFKIAEADLRQRGPGQLFGTRQHGLPELRFGDILNDFGLLEIARQDAFDIVARDPKLALPEHARMLPRLRRVFGEKLSLLDAG